VRGLRLRRIAVVAAILLSVAVSKYALSPAFGADSVGVAAHLAMIGIVGSGGAPTQLYINAPNASPIASLHRLPDGASVCLKRRPITGVFPGYFYVEDVDRCAGIRVITTDYAPPEGTLPGDLATLSGTMGTHQTERVIYATSAIQTEPATGARISPIAMNNFAIQGGLRDVFGNELEGIHWLLPTGLLIRVAGRITARDYDIEGWTYAYVDDGRSRKDGAAIDASGIRVYYDDVGQFSTGSTVIATGILTWVTDYNSVGAQILIPAVKTVTLADIFPPGAQPAPTEMGSVTGTVRLVGANVSGQTVRVHSQLSDAMVVTNAAGEATFTLSRIPADGGFVAACCGGFTSDTVSAKAGDSGLLLVLESSTPCIEIERDKSVISVCHGEYSRIAVLVRDCEGKGMPGQQVKVSTTLGRIMESQPGEPGYPKSVVLITDAAGFVTPRVSANGDGVGVAQIDAVTYPGEDCRAATWVELRGPNMAIWASPYRLSSPGNSQVSVELSDNEVPLTSARIVFTTDFGTFVDHDPDAPNRLTIYTDSAAVATATLQIAAPGSSKVIATYTNECGQDTIAWAVIHYSSNPWKTGSVLYANPMVADLDLSSDGHKEIAFVDAYGVLQVVRSDGSTYWTKTMHPPGGNTPSCAVVPTEGSGRPCVFVPAENQTRVHAYAYDGKVLAGWPVGSFYRIARGGVALGDANLDGSMEIIAADECCYVSSWNPTGDWRKTGTADSSFLWRNLTGTPSTTVLGSTPAIGDIASMTSIEPDGLPDVVVGAHQTKETFAFPGDIWGDFSDSPRYLHGWPKAGGIRVKSSPAIGDIDGDGLNDIAVGGEDGNLYIWSSLQSTWTGYPTGGAVDCSPALCEMNGQPGLEVVVGSGSGKLFAFDSLGRAPAGWAGGIRLNLGGTFAIESSPVVGDVTGDGVCEVVVGCNDGSVYAIHLDGTNHTAYGELTGPIAWTMSCIPPTDSAGRVLGSPVIDDIDADGKVDLLVAAEKGIYLAHLDAAYTPGPQTNPWPTFHHDNQRSGCASAVPTPTLASVQGLVTKNGIPVLGADVEIFFSDGSPVPRPYSDPPVSRVAVKTVGTTDPNEVGKGAYCINQLTANTTYKIRVSTVGGAVKWLESLYLVPGLNRIDVAL